MKIFTQTYASNQTVPTEVLLKSRRIRMFPILFFQFYLTASVIVFAFGPWPWPVPDPVKLYTFLFVAQLALWFGYKSGLATRPGRYYGRLRLAKMLTVSLLVNIIWIIPSYMLALKMQSASISTITTAIATGIADPGFVYAQKRINAVGAETGLLNYINLLIRPVLWLLFPLAVFHWHRLSFWFKFCVVFVVISGLLKWVALGTTKGVADFFLLLPVLLLAANPLIIKRIKVKAVFKIFSVSLLSIILLLSFFLYMQQGRGDGTIRMYNYNANIYLDEQNPSIILLPLVGKAAVGAITSYLSQGYYGLSLALTEPFSWSYGVGNSFFFTGLTEHFTGPGVVSEKTYPVKIEKYGWLSHNNWHSIYTWIASDLTFPGTIVFVFLIGRLFAMVWLDVLQRENPYAVPLFALLTIMLFYFPANNQVLAFPDTATAFLVILTMWIITRRKYRYIS